MSTKKTKILNQIHGIFFELTNFVVKSFSVVTLIGWGPINLGIIILYLDLCRRSAYYEPILSSSIVLTILSVKSWFKLKENQTLPEERKISVYKPKARCLGYEIILKS